MNQEEYLKNRVDHRINWYDRKSCFNQNWFKRLQVIAILSASTIPFLTGYSSGEDVSIRVCIGILGLMVAAITAVLSLYKFQENWHEYRTTCESLTHEKYLYLTNTEPYDIPEPFPLLVQRVEMLISKENSMWSHHVATKKEKNG